MTIQHIALAKVDDSFVKGTREEMYAEIRRRVADVPVPKHHVRVGPPLRPATTRGYDIMLSVTFDKRDDFQAYLAHPKHIQLMKDYGPPFIKGMISYQLDDMPNCKL